MKISAVILTKNEEGNIERCLESVDFCEQIIIIDDNSTDNTLKKFPKTKKLETNNSQNSNYQKIKIYKRKLNGDFAGQRNFGIAKAANEWVLFMDADEEISDELKKEIDSLFHGFIASEIEALYLKRRDYFWGREMKWGETKKVRDYGLIRLMKKGSGEWEGRVHEEYKLKTQMSNVKTLNGYINHHPHQNIKKFLQKINFYSSLRAKELKNTGKKTNIFEIIFFPFGKFLYTYFLKLGFLDGPAGFAYGFLMSFHSFLVRVKMFQY